VRKILGLNWAPDKDKLHCGFRSTSYDTFVPRLIDGGLKIVVVDQVETTQEFFDRVNKKTKGIANREIMSVSTIGTSFSIDNPTVKWILALWFDA